jgi:transcriptional repressor of cell division inhibition gene dicB
VDKRRNGGPFFPLDFKTAFRYFSRMRKEMAIRHYGTQQKLANALGCSQGTVSGWPEVIPLGRAFILEKLTEGALKVDLALYPEARPIQQPSQ